MLNNKKKIKIISAIILVFFIAFSYNYYLQRKFNETDHQLNRLMNWMNSKNVPCTSTLDDNKNIFTFDHIGFGKEGDVGWTRIMKNNEIKDSLGFYTRHIDPILTPLTENTLIGSAWQWPKDSELGNGPFFNYHLNFNTRKTEELPTRGRLITITNDRTKAVFLESECVKNPDSLKLGTECNDQNLSLRIIELPKN